MDTILKRYAILIFLSFTSISYAQESKEILDLKEQLSTAKTDKDKIVASMKLYLAYVPAQKIDSAMVYSKNVLYYQKKNGDKEASGQTSLMVAELYMLKGDFSSMLNYLKEGDKILENSKDYTNKALVNHMYGVYNLYALKNNEEASKYFRKNIQYYKEGKSVNKHFVMFAYRGLFANNYLQNKFGDAYELTNTYLDFVKKNYPEKLNEAHLGVASFYSTTKDYDRANYFYKKSNSLTSKSDLNFINTNYSLLGLNYAEAKKSDSAKYYLDKAYQFFKEKNPQSLGVVYLGYSKIYKDERNYDLAESYIQKAIELAPEQDLQSTKFLYESAYIDIQVDKLLTLEQSSSENSTRKTDLENLLAKLNNQQEYLKNGSSVIIEQSIVQNNENLYKVHEQLGNYKEALFYYKKYVEGNEKIYGLDNMRKLSDAQSDYEVNQERIRVKLQEESKRLELQKEMELKALRFEYEKKQAAAKTEEEKKRLALEEDLKRREIQLTYEQQQKALNQKYEQERQIAKINQEKKDAVAKAEIESSKLQKNVWAVGAGLSLLLLGFAGFSYFQKRKDNQRIAEEKQKSDDLLLNILPHEVAEELKAKGETQAKHYDEVSVLFTDFVSFTSTSERLGVQEVLNELNICFTEFDRIMDKYGLEKIKTIGDAYLAVSGLPVSTPQHAQNAVNAGLEIIKFINERRQSNPNALDIRVGIHSGPVIAGIVGVKKFAYDVWGDTVNTAARMEQNSEKGRLNISGTTYNMISGDFNCEYRGKIETKGKGALDMYFVNPN